MENGWIKLHRKAKENGILKDHKAWAMFSWILMSVDRRTGTYTVGRFMLAQALGIDPSTAYKVLKRLEKKWEVVTLESNNKFTTISLLHWADYQSIDEPVTQEGNNKVTTKEQQSNTLQEYKNKELKNNDKSLGKPFGNEKINLLIDDFKKKLSLPVLDDSENSNRRYAWLCIQKFGLDKTLLAIEATARSRFWHTKITSFKSLYYNAVKIVSSGRGEVRSIEANKILDSEDEGRKGVQYLGGGVLSSEKSLTSGD